MSLSKNLHFCRTSSWSLLDGKLMRAKEGLRMARHYTLVAVGTLMLALLGAGTGIAQMDEKYQPNAESKKYPEGSAMERRARMAAIAAAPAYTRKFDLSGLPEYVPEGKPTGTLRLCGNNYIGDSPLAGWWKDAFAKYQPGIKIELHLDTAATAVPCVAFDLADIGITHEPSFYDYLSYQRLKGHPPTGITILTGSYDVVGWQNNFVIVVNRANPITKVSMTQLDGIFGSQRAGGWVRTTWHPEFARGPEKDLRTWGQLGLTGDWANRPINTYGYSLRYATALEFSDKVLHSTDKWNENLLGFGNFTKADGKTYLEADQIVDHVRDDPNAIGFVRYHPKFPTDIKILDVGVTDAGPFVHYSMENLQSHSYPLWGGQSFWIDIKPGEKVDPKIREFTRFVLSRQGQELLERDGKYLPLDAATVQEGLKKLQ
jgi:phosphate transport system substrate-binding protein